MDNFKVIIRKLDWTITYCVYANEYYVCTVVEAIGQKFAVMDITKSTMNRPEHITHTLQEWLHLAPIKGK